MSLGRFLKSKSFFLSLIGAIGIFVLLIFGVLQFLKIYTKHDQKIEIPNLKKMKADKALQVLEDSGLEMVIIDTVDFTTDVPPLTVAWQDPSPNTYVKSARKIYVKLNAKNFSSVRLPKLENRSLRHAVANIEMLGLVKGKIIYEPSFARDVVLRVEQEGRILRQGDKVLKNSKIDFVLGDGSLGYKATSNDTVAEEVEEVAPAIDSIF